MKLYANAEKNNMPEMKAQRKIFDSFYCKYPQNNCFFLKDIRESRNITLYYIHFKTKISFKNLAAIEAEEFEKLPEWVFLRGYLIQICKILDLSEDQVIPFFYERYCLAKKTKK